MSSLPSGVLWDAEPHTRAKIEIVKGYLYRWAVILGQSFPELTYIDGFAGPGEYKNRIFGSPVAGLEALNQAKAATPKWVAGTPRVLFIEKDVKRFEHLKTLCLKLNITEGVQFQCADFVSGLQFAQQKMGSAIAGRSPLLVFVDPFGATGAPFQAIRRILSSERSEVILNFDADGVARIWSAGESSRHERLLTQIFGDDSWRGINWEGLSHRDRCLECARLYKRNLLSLPGVNYAFAFEMGNSSNRLDYFLIFASRHERGLEKMKEAMQEIDQTGDFKFYDTLVGQGTLFRFDSPDRWIDPLVASFAGRTVPFKEVKKWILNETPFFLFKASILKPAAERGLIEAIPKAGFKISHGQFPESKLVQLKFRK